MKSSFHLALRRALTSSPSPSPSLISRNLASAAAAAATTPAPSPRASTRSTYSRVKPTTSSVSTTATGRRTTPTARITTSNPSIDATEPFVSTTTTSSSDLAALAALEEENFPIPDPSSVLPDYAKLGPPLDISAATTPFARRSSILTPQSTVGIQGEEPISEQADWSNSFHGLSSKPFDREIAERLMRPLSVKDVEMKPDGLLYLPEIKYRRTLNEAFGPGGWGLAPRGETNVGPRIVSREWGLVCLGRLVAIARGEQEYFDPSGVPTATEACKSNALMRCCKDLGIASELWDPSFIREFKSKHCVEAFVEHVVSKKKRKLWRKKEAKFEYPYKET